MVKTLSLSEVKIKLSQLVNGIVDRDDEIVITRNGKPAAVLISAEEYENWQETYEIMADTDLVRQIRSGTAAVKKSGKRYSLDQLFKS